MTMLPRQRPYCVCLPAPSRPRKPCHKPREIQPCLVLGLSVAAAASKEGAAPALDDLDLSMICRRSLRSSLSASDTRPLPSVDEQESLDAEVMEEVQESGE